MSMLSKFVKRHGRKLAAPLAIGALALPGVGVGIAAGVTALGRAAGRATRTGAPGAVGALEAVTAQSRQTTDLLSGLPGIFAAGAAEGAAPGALGRIKAHAPQLALAAGASFLLWRLWGRRPGRRPSFSRTRR